MAQSSDPGNAVENLLQAMAALRGEGGCPWDRRQTHRSLVPYLIEEAYEVVEAIEGENDDAGAADEALREELGDLLLQVVFHARIAEERGAFDFADVAADLTAKLRERHPHVFAGATVDSAQELGRVWHERKMATRESALDGIPAALPALQQAAKASHAAARAGFDWNRAGDILDKAEEELAEFREAVEALEAAKRSGGEEYAGDDAAREEMKREREMAQEMAQEMELGDLLFALVQMARRHEIDPETALRRSTRKFMARFRWMEKALAESGTRLDSATGGEWWNLWSRAKADIPG